jgi:hypothetical protein
MRSAGKLAGRHSAAPIAVVLALTLGGCSMGNLSGSSSTPTASAPTASGPAPNVSDRMARALLGPPVVEGTAAAAPATEVECPGVEVRPGASTLSIAGQGKGTEGGAALDLRYQGSIVRTARECQVRAGNMTMKIGVEGRLVLGPAGGPGQLDIPLRLAVVHEGTAPKTIITKFVRIPVTVPPDEGRVSFSHIAEDMTFPMPARAVDIDAYVVYVGFDPAGAAEPKAKKPAAKKKPRQPR